MLSRNLCYASSSFLYKFVDPKKKTMIVKLIGPTIFFPYCQLCFIPKSLAIAFSFKTIFFYSK